MTNYTIPCPDDMPRLPNMQVFILHFFDDLLQIGEIDNAWKIKFPQSEGAFRFYAFVRLCGMNVRPNARQSPLFWTRLSPFVIHLRMLAEFLLGSFRTRLLSALLLHPDTTWHAREVARRIGALPASTNRELVKLAQAGILLRRPVGNQVHYQANRANPIFAELAGLLRKTAGLATVLADALAPLASKVQYALVFGSVARGEETAESDVDLLILGDLGFAEALHALHPVQAYIQREINPVVYSVENFLAKLASKNTWAREVVDKPKLFLIGHADDFAKLVGDLASS